ncbi:Bcr/CflA family drug resistance efflux transporter [Sphaerisporangium melleum]|nr:Bcr/CflA family drug resistance efflux transporter [Sphaerisporangium melleum]
MPGDRPSRPAAQGGAMSATSTVTAPAPRAPSRSPAAVLGLLAALVPLGGDMYLPGLAPLARDLRTGVLGAQLTLSAFFLGVAAGHFVLGRLSDRYGRRGPLLTCLAVSALAAAACALAPHVAALAGARFVQGLAGAAGVVIGRAVVSDLARGRRSARAFSAMMWTIAAAPIAAPVLGGVLIAAAGWRAVFAALAVLGLLAFLAALIALPETLPLHARTVTFLPGPTGRSLLRDRDQVAPAVAFALGFGALAAYLAAAPFFLRDLLGPHIAPVAATLTLNALALVLVAAAGARLAYRFPPLWPARAGLAVLLVCAGLLGAAAATGGLNAGVCLPLLLLAVASLGLVLGDTSAVALARAPRAAGVAAALMASLQFVIGAATAPLAGLGGARAVLPAAAVMGACAVLGLLALTAAEPHAGRDHP